MMDDRVRGPAAFGDAFARRGGRVVLASRAMQQRLNAASVAVPTELIPLPIEFDRYTPSFTNSESDDRWRQVLGDRPLPDGVRILGPRPRTELVAIQQHVALTLYPSRFPEMFCLAVAESTAAGAPVITSPLDALAERVENGRTGFLIEGDIDQAATQHAFAQAAIELLTHPARRSAMASAGRAAARELSPERVAGAWEALIG